MTLTISFRKHSLREFSSIFRFSLRKNLGTLLLYGFLQMILLPLILLIHLMNVYANRGSYGATEDVLLPSAFSSCLNLLFPIAAVPLMLVFVIVFSIQLFRYMHGKRSVDLFHSLPVRRTPLLLGKYCAGLFSLLIPFLCNILLCVIIGALYGALDAGTAAFLVPRILWFLIMAASCFAFAMLAAVCSGTTMEMMLSGILVSVSWPLSVLLVMVLVESLLPGYMPKYDITAITALSPVVAAFLPFAMPIFSATVSAAESTASMPVFFTVWWIVLPVAMLIAAVAAYRRRKSESAENTISLPVVKILIRLMTTFAAGLGFGFLMYAIFNMGRAFFIGALAGSVAAHIVAQALYARGFKGMLKSFRWYAVPAVLFFALYFSLATGFFGYDTRIPKADEIASAQIELPQSFYQAQGVNEGSYYSYDYNRGYFYGEKGETLVSVCPQTDDPAILKEVTELHQTVVENNRSLCYPYRLNTFDQIAWDNNIEIEYTLKNGSVFSRKVPISYGGSLYETLYQKGQAIASSETFRKQSNLAYYLEPEYIDTVDLNGSWSSQTLKPGSAIKQELLDAILADSGNFGYYEDYAAETAEGDLPAATDKYGNVTISLNLQSSFSLKEGSVLYDLTGGYSGPVSYNGGASFTVNPRCTHTLAFFEKEGWDIDALNEGEF